MDHASAVEIPTVKGTEHIMSGAAAGLRTCTKDLLTLYNAFMTAANDQFATGKTSTSNSPLKQVAHLMSAAIPMNGPTMSESSYALGWVRVQLPRAMGAVGINPPLMLGGMPIVGKGVPSRLVVYHEGSFPGALSAVFLLSDSRTAIVAMSNSLALNDCPDWVAQLVLEEILSVPEDKKNDYIEVAKTSAAQTLQWYPTTIASLSHSQKHHTSARPLDAYTGTYKNTIKTMKMVITVEKNSLYYAVQGLESDILTLYEDDIFTWIRPRDELAARGRWVDQRIFFWKIRFGVGVDGEVDRLHWVHDFDVEEGETFHKSAS